MNKYFLTVHQFNKNANTAPNAIDINNIQNYIETDNSPLFPVITLLNFDTKKEKTFCPIESVPRPANEENLSKLKSVSSFADEINSYARSLKSEDNNITIEIDSKFEEKLYNFLSMYVYVEGSTKPEEYKDLLKYLVF